MTLTAKRLRAGTADHVHVVSYFVMPDVGETPEEITDSLDEARDVVNRLPAYRGPVRIVRCCCHCDFAEEVR